MSNSNDMLMNVERIADFAPTLDENEEDGRRHRKEHLAAALRIFGFSEGVPSELIIL